LVSLAGKSNNNKQSGSGNKAFTEEGEQMKDLIAKLKSKKTKAAVKSYLRAVLASAVTMGLALAADLTPEYAILIGSVAAPLAKWADKTEKEYGIGSK
jgi:hypothetical protein